MSLSNGLNWWDYDFAESSKPEFHLFDLTSDDIDLLAIKKFNSGNCFVIDESGNYYNGFVLSRNKQTQTECRIDFFAPKETGKHVPRPLFQIVKNADGSIKESNNGNDRTRRISFQDENEGRENFWKLMQFLAKFKNIVDLGEFNEKYKVLTSKQLTEYLNNKSNYSKVLEAADGLNISVSSILKTTITIKLLREYREKLDYFIKNASSETEVQNWIDEDGHKYRQQRCMIFGLEYIDFKREGSTSSKKFDVLTRVGSKYIDYVLIELKSPSDNIFEVSSSGTINDSTYEYKIHKELARAIPQILEYKRSLEQKEPGDAELEKLGIMSKPHIGKCIIVIGAHKDDPRWLSNRENLMRSLNSSLEIWTYTELQNKLDATIENLSRNIKDA